MDFTLSEEQHALRDAVRGLLGKHYASIGARRTTTASDPGFDEQVWAELAALGALALPFAEELGGVGAGPVEVGVVAEEIGRVLAPEPYVEAVVLAGGLVAEAGTPQQKAELIGGLVSGESLLAFAGNEPGRRYAADAVAVTATRAGDEWRLTGTKEPVIQGARADVLIVSAAIDGGTGLFLVARDAEGVSRTGYRTHDGGRAARLEFTDAVAVPLGEAGVDQLAAIEDALDRARIASAHEALGASEFALATTVGYLKTRKQFGVTLNTFQALTHRAADMLIELELMRSTISWASIAQDDGGSEHDLATLASQTWLQTGRAVRLIGQEAIQLHGGIGMTAEYSGGHYTSRLTALAHLAGDRAFHRGRLTERLGTHESFDPMG
jgi:alkylation response protein AidB-like acyl-CoA dehydrogenase